MRSPLKNSAGFSLAEVIIAITLLGIMVFVIANIPQAIRIISSSQVESKVREVVAKKMEDIRLTGYDNLPIGTTNFSDPRLSSLTAVSAVTTVVDCPAAVCAGGEPIKQVTIEIAWNENNNDKNFQVVTLVGKGGLK